MGKNALASSAKVIDWKLAKNRIRNDIVIILFCAAQKQTENNCKQKYRFLLCPNKF